MDNKILLRIAKALEKQNQLQERYNNMYLRDLERLEKLQEVFLPLLKRYSQILISNVN